MKLGEQVKHQNRLIGYRDAFHVACVLCEIDEDAPVHSGQYVRLTSDAMSRVFPCKPGETPHGIVDPFIPAGEKVGPYEDKLVWVLLFPGVAVNLTHKFDIKCETDDESTWDCRGCN